jgi:hypothetical protein
MASTRARWCVVAGLFLLFCTAAYGQGLKGEYFPNMTLSGQPVLTRTENVGFNWAGGAPGPGVNADNFSVRWTGSLTPPESGNYIFGTRSDDGIRLWVGGDQVINNWGDHSATWNRCVPVSLVAGEPVAIRLEFYENGGDAVSELYWSGPGIDEQIIPASFLSPTVVPSVKARKPNPANGALSVLGPLLEWTAGDGATFHNVYLGATPDLTEADLVAAHQYFTIYYHVPGLTPGATYYWRVDEIEADGVTTHPGDVWSFTMQALTAYHPTPADGAADASVAPTLTWLAGAGGTKHQVYFGGSLDAVTQGAAATNKGTLALEEPALTPGALEPLTTYYWRVDEILVDGTTKTGTVWSFTTCLPVDDFESYTDQAGSEVFSTWIDGFTDGLSGSIVGYPTSANGTFGETTVVHGGTQSMPMDYNNVNAPFYSEAQQEFATAQNWTTGGANTLVLYVRGMVANAPAPLYVTLEDASKGTATVVHPNATVVNSGQWVQWKIPLSEFAGVNAAKIKKMTVGVGDKSKPAKGGSGRIFLDDIGVIKS